MFATYTSSYPADTNDRICSTCSSTLSPATTLSAVEERVTSWEACSKCCGEGSTCASSPGSPALAHSRCAWSTPSSAVAAQATLKPPWAGLPPDFSLNDETMSSSSWVQMKPSAICPATSSAFGPKADM